jgi:hypothetical protein
MTDSSDTTVMDDADLITADSVPMFYVVSKRKLAILFVATFGLYTIYWFYKNWDRYKDNKPYASEVGSTIWPVPRALFSVFFVHSLFRKVKEYGTDKPAVAQWRNTLDATLLVISMIVWNLLDRAADKSMGSPYTDFLALAILMPLVLQFCKAQDMINSSCNDPNGDTNRRFSKANYAWVIGGALFWIVVVIGFMGGDSSAPYDSGMTSGF